MIWNFRCLALSVEMTDCRPLSIVPWVGENNRMPSIRHTLEQMRQYQPPLYREADFESFWQQTANEAVRQPLNVELIPYDLGAKSSSALPSASTVSRAAASPAGISAPTAKAEIPASSSTTRLPRPRHRRWI